MPERHQQRAELLAATPAAAAARARAPRRSSLPRSIRISPSASDWRVHVNAATGRKEVDHSMRLQMRRNPVSAKDFASLPRRLSRTSAHRGPIAACLTRLARSVRRGRVDELSSQLAERALAAAIVASMSSRVRGGHEARLERRRREVDAGVEHRVEEAVEALLVARHHLGVRLSGTRAREIDARTCRRPPARRTARRRAAPPPPARRRARACVRRAARRSRAPRISCERREPGRDRDRIARQRAAW